MTDERDEDITAVTEDKPWWAMSPKTQIILIALAFGLFNLLLIALFAAFIILRSS